MKKVFKIVSVVLALTLIVTAFAACGGNDDGGEPKAKATAKVIDIELTEEQYAFAVDKNQPELLTAVNEFIAESKENGKLDEIFDKYFGDGTPTPVESAELDTGKDQLVVATSADFPPFEYTEGSKFLGIDMEIAKLLADKLGKELVIQHMDFEAVCMSVNQQKCDIAMAGLTVDPQRAEIINFSESYYMASQKLIIRSDDTRFDNCKTKEDVVEIIRGMDSSVKVGCQTGTTGEKYITNTEDYAENAFKVTSVPLQNGALAVQDMLNGNLSFVIIDGAPAAAIAKAANAAV